MSCKRATSLNPTNNFWVLLRILPSKLRIRPMAEGIGPQHFVSSFRTSKPISRFLCKSIRFGSFYVRNLSPFSENPNVFPHRWMSTSSNQQSFTVHYLVKSLGFSPESALSVSKNVDFKTNEKPDKVIKLFKKFGFTQTQISSLVRASPVLLLLDAEKIILPKLEFLKANGISGPQMTKSLSISPALLRSSLTKQIIPSYDFLSNLFQSDERVNATIKRHPDILTYNIEKHVKPTINILREHGVPDSNVATLMMYSATLARKKPDQLREILKKVEDMGFESSKVKFVLAVNTFLSMTKSRWEGKVDAYKKCGWSEEEVLKAFQRHPWCMMTSEDKIMAGMNFFVNKMGSRPSNIADHPKLLSLSLKKRLIPRYSVFQVLLSKGLLKKEVSLAVLFDSQEKKFLQNFVVPYKEEAPEVMKLYKDKLNLANGPLVDKV